MLIVDGLIPGLSALAMETRCGKSKSGPSSAILPERRVSDSLEPEYSCHKRWILTTLPMQCPIKSLAVSKSPCKTSAVLAGFRPDARRGEGKII